MAAQKKNTSPGLRRLQFLAGLVMVLWGLVLLRYFQVQLIQQEDFMKKRTNRPAAGKWYRGQIYDRNGLCLAGNQSIFDVEFDKKVSGDVNTDRQNKRAILDKLPFLLSKTRNKLEKRLSLNTRVIKLAVNIPESTAEKIKQLKLPGIRMVEKSERNYPFHELGSRLVGFVGDDGHGRSGLEYALDSKLVFDPLEQNFSRQRVHAVTPDHDIQLTIDCRLQKVLQDELEYSMKLHNAVSAIGVLVNPNTGEVLANVSLPEFDLNGPQKPSIESQRNRVTGEAFEAGSIMKPMLMAAIVQENIRNLNEKIYCENGKYHVQGELLSDHKSFGTLSVTDILVNSSNIGMAKLSGMLNNQIFYKYARSFGFGRKTNVGINGETAGRLKPTSEWSAYTPIAMSMGYEMSVTLMQVAMMYSTIANGGRLLKPIITLPDNRGAELKPSVAPEMVRRVLTEATALQMRRIMEQVVERGTGKNARVDGLRICGKTGTSHKYNKTAGGYYAHKYWASFSGFFPSHNPQYVLCVSFDNPSPRYYGGDVAAPAFKRIVQRMLNIGEIREKVNDKPGTQVVLQGNIDNSATIMPDFANRRWNTASQILDKMGVNAHKNNEGVYIVGQDPAPGKKLENGRRARFDLATIPTNVSMAVKMPDLVGLSLREAVNQLDRLRVGSQINGSGKVVQQSVSPGAAMPAEAVCQLTCRPPVNIGQFSNW